MHPYSDKLQVLLVPTLFKWNTYCCNLQDSNAIVGEVLNLLIPASLLEVRVAPRVVVEGEEVRSHVIGATVHILSRLHTVRGHIGGRVANRDFAKTTGVHVVLHITSDSLDIGSRLVSVLFVIDDFVAREEGKRVGVLGKHLDSGENTLKVLGVVRGTRVAAVDGVLGVVDIENQVDAGILEGLHTLVVVRGVVDSIHTDGVDAKILEISNVAKANIGVAKGILVSR